MAMVEYSYEEDIQVKQQEAMQKGQEEGWKEGRKEGREEGLVLSAQIFRTLQLQSGLYRYADCRDGRLQR